MFGTHDLWLFLLTGLVLNLTPGADTLYVVSRTAQGGFKHGVAGALGICAGCFVHALAAALGVAAILATSAFAFEVVKMIGAAYLAWLGIGMLRQAWHSKKDVHRTIHAPLEPKMPEEAHGISGKHVFAQGVLTNVLNPKVALFFLAFVPQFIGANAASPLLSFLFLAVLFNLTGGAWLAVVVWTTARLRGRIAPAAARWLNGIGGALFMALAARLAFSRHSS